ncbi:MAG: arginine--tRNA ligase [Gammaproteobacteria bacterium]|nr:arginine--tRNA ligase [Gammaproteobacteria bacterium]MYA67083.1 arginine--tRNA ligase [Gammaproteobacteria bacterium]MYG96413.1 arginine--tRNA ligase [Gammaproteobacteria bacterium]MYH45965.1 arginine--tRNA ligase [Gammaproteobacteria bacterium]MYL14531.1 arginine--tRNA ligase [Gammaproteobacteria bacterium]
MENIREQLSRLVGEALNKASGIADCDPNVITASRPEFGDYQVDGVMAAAGRCGRKPRELAEAAIAGMSDEDSLVASVEVAGPGFINIRLNDQALMARGNEVLRDPQSLIPADSRVQKIVVDQSSPNLAKEMHVGHLRGTVIGDCLSRVLERLGHEVIRQNHVGDWGTQFGMLIAYMRELDREFNKSASLLQTELEDLETFYRAAKDKFDSDPAFADRARLSVVRLQGGDPEYLEAWQSFIDESLRHCQEIYRRLDVGLTLADLDAESRYNDDLEGIIRELDEKGLLQESDGARCVFLPEFKGKDGEPLPVIVQKSDGGYLYSTTDLAAVKMRSFDFEADRSLYVVDARQSLHFRQVFAVAQAADMASANISLEHIAYGTIMGSDGRPYKTRSGDSVKLADLLDEAVARALELVSEKNPDLAEDERRLIAENIGIASVKYADLSKNRMSDYVFDWSTMLSFEGNTAPYLLYACTRIKSLLRKRPQESPTEELTSLEHAEERALLLKILQLPEVVSLVARECYPNLLCNYLFELAGVFMRFYEACPVLKAEPQTRDSRLALALLAEQALEQGLDLLGIQTLERM